MSEIIVAYWSGTGNTGAMAEYVAQGIREGGKEAKIVNVENFSADELKDCSVFALGCPSMGVEVLEEGYMEPFMCDVDGFAAGKKIGLFGSYGWGGTWLEDWGTRIKDAGGELVADGVAILGEPDDDGKAQCEELGKTLANA